MVSKSREFELAQSLLQLQSQFNDMVRAKDFWRNSSKGWQDKLDEVVLEHREIIEEKDREIVELKRLLDGAKNLIESMNERAKSPSKKNAKGTQA